MGEDHHPWVKWEEKKNPHSSVCLFAFPFRSPKRSNSMSLLSDPLKLTPPPVPQRGDRAPGIPNEQPETPPSLNEVNDHPVYRTRTCNLPRRSTRRPSTRNLPRSPTGRTSTRHLPRRPTGRTGTRRHSRPPTRRTCTRYIPGARSPRWGVGEIPGARSPG